MLLAVVSHAMDVWPVSDTGSMEPIFNENYFIFTEVRPFKEIKVGDIIIYKAKQPWFEKGQWREYVVHMVWNRSSGGSVLICKGVANDKPDSELITEDMYVATVVKWQTREDYFK